MSLISSDSSHGLADHEQSTLWSPSQLHMPLFGEENWPAEWATDDSSPKSSKSDSSTSSDSLAASEDHEDLARQVARLEAQVQELARELKYERKKQVTVQGRYKRKVRNFKRDVEQFEDTLTHIQNWGHSVNGVLQPMVKERLEFHGVGIAERVRAEEFCEMVEDNALTGGLDDSDSE